MMKKRVAISPNVRLSVALASQRPRLAEGLDADILANIGHELRTPLTIIQGLSELLLDTVDEEEHRDFLRQIHKASLRLGKLVETSILLTKINAGQLEPQPMPTSVAEAVDRVMRQHHEEIAAKALRVDCAFPPDLPPILADGICFELVLQALSDNAVKFNRQGGHIRWEGRQEDAWIHLTVTDSGVGILADKLPTLFELFHQAESGMTRRFGGLGLGLPLVRRLLDNMGGRISVESPGPDRGSMFTISLPAVSADWL